MRPLDSFAEASGVDVRRLRYFVTIAEELHFGRASERLNVAPSARSRQMDALEATIGATSRPSDSERIVEAARVDPKAISYSLMRISDGAEAIISIYKPQ